MGKVWDDITKWFDDIATNIIKGITGGVKWLNAQIKYYHGKIVQAVADAASDPWKFLGIILGSVLVQIGLQSLYDVLKKQAIVQSTLKFIASINSVVSSTTKFLHLDLILLTISISDKLIEAFHGKLAELYEELSALSETIGKDVSFITIFAEINRSLIYSAYEAFPNGYLEAESKYAEGFATWLGNLKDRLGKYTEDPSLVFLDMAKEIAGSYAKDNNKEIKKLWAGVGAATTWIMNTGENIVASINIIETSLDTLPDEIKAEMKIWYEPLKKEVDDFIKNSWTPFQEKYDIAIGELESVLDAQGESIEEIRATLNNPADWLRMIGLMKPKEQAYQYDGMNEFDRVLAGYIAERNAETVRKIEKDASNRLDNTEKDIPFPIDDKDYRETVTDLDVNPTSESPSWFVGDGTGYPYPHDAMSDDGNSWFIGE